MISQKAKYALKALIALAAARGPGAEPLRIEEIAARSGTPKRFLEQILLDIKRAGVIGSRRGREGGYLMIKDPAEVSLASILRLIDGPVAPLPCLSRTAYRPCEDCADEESCAVRRVFADLFASYLLLLESITLADAVRGGVPALATSPG